MGLELYLDEYLAGKDGIIQYIKDKRGYLQPNKEEYVVVSKHMMVMIFI